MRFNINAGLGDCIAATAVIREYKRCYPDEIIEGVDTNFPDVYMHNPHIGPGTVLTPRTVTLSHFRQSHGNCGHIGYSYAQQAGIQLYSYLPEIHLLPEELTVGHGLVQKHPAVAIDTWARWPSRRWPHARYAAVVAALRARGWYVVEVGGPATDYAGNLNETRLDVDLQLFGAQRVRETAAVVAACDYFIGNESGTAHMAAAVGTPQVVLYSLTNINARLYVTGVPVRSANPCLPGCREFCAQPQANHCLLDISPEHFLAAFALTVKLWGFKEGVAYATKLA